MLTTAHTVARAHHALAPYYFAARPASVIANPTILALSIFGLLGGSLLAVDTLWSVVHKLIEDPHPRWHPLTVRRWEALLVALALILYIAPDAVVFTTWPDVSPATRHTISLVNRFGDFAAAAPAAGWWLLAIYAGPTIDHQLVREPLPVELWPSWRKLRRPLWIGLLVMLASVALSFGR